MFVRVSMLAGMALFANATGVPAAAGDPSFDCDTARKPVERLICADDELSALDLALARAYAGALARAPASRVGSLKAAHSAWRREMMQCEKDSDARACTLAAYQDRLAQM